MSHIFGLEHTLSGIAGQAASFMNPFGGSPSSFVPVPGGSPGFSTAAPPAGEKVEFVVDPSTGQCVMKKKKTRRRRPRLATASDIADLSALESVLGKGQMLKTWIATRRMR